MHPAALLLSDSKIIKQVIYLVLGIVILFVIYKYGSEFKARLASKKVIKAGELEIVENAATFNNSDYLAMADKLYTAMNGAGTDNESVLQTVSSLKTKTDWLKLVEAYGVRKSDSLFSSFQGNLIQWLSDELSGKDRQQVNYSLSRFNIQV